MRIGVELVHISEGVTGGLAPYLRGVLQELFTGWPEHEVVLFRRADAGRLLHHTPAHVHDLRLPFRLYFPLLDVQSLGLRLDVLFRSYPYDGGLTFPTERQVFLIPDLQHEYHPDFFTPEVLQGRQAGFNQALSHGGAILTLSEHARQTLRSCPAGRDAEIFVAPPALLEDSDACGDLTDAERALLPDRDYFFYPANVWPHKNHRRILQAFASFLEGAGRPFEFIFTGHPDGWDEVAKDFPGLPVRHLGFVHRRLLRALLARARALIFFSLYEGFGMPLLEAFAAGTPVACSGTTSLPEVGGDAVLMADPTDVGAMSGAMAQVDADEGLRTRLTVRGKGRLGLYNWRDSAAQLVKACSRAAGRVPATAAAARLPSFQRLNESIRDIDADANARLLAIHQLDAESTARLHAIHTLHAETEARLAAIHKLNDAIHERNDVLKQVECAHLNALEELRQARNALSARTARKIRGLARRLLGPFRRGARPAAPPGRTAEATSMGPAAGAA